jgi:hypothetical protein
VPHAESRGPREGGVAAVSASTFGRTIDHAEIPMPWLRCPFGCIFEIDQLEHDGFAARPDDKVACKACHRLTKFRKYQPGDTSQAVAAVDGVYKPDQPTQLGLEKTVRTKISQVMGNIRLFGYDQERQVELLYHKVVSLLIDSELTSNFPTSKIWAILASGGQLRNMWAQGQQLLDQQGAPIKYNNERNQGEVRLFGGLSGNVSNAPTGSGRPYYIALSPGCLQQGAAPYYGRSYTVYRDTVKLRCTYMATDSLQILKAKNNLVDLTDVCSFQTIANILLGVSDRELKYLCSLALGQEAVSPNEFIEAQGWGELTLANDVKYIVISENDLKTMETETSTHADHIPASLIPMNLIQRKQAITQMKIQLQQYCTQHGITLKYLPLGPDTMNSNEKRAG